MENATKDLTGPEMLVKLRLELNEAKNKARLMASLHCKEVCELHGFRNKMAELLGMDTKSQEWFELTDRERQEKITNTLECINALANLK